MAYASWSVVYGEQPSAAKWNILGTNDASFNDGTGIGGLYKDLLSVDSNPYKFSVYKSSGTQTVNTGGYTKVTFDAETFDTNNNFTSSTYTVPVTGFYTFAANLAYNLVGSGSRLMAAVYKNGAILKKGDDRNTNAASGNATVATGIVSLSSGDAIEIYAQPVGANTTISNANAPSDSCFSGYLISRT